MWSRLKRLIGRVRGTAESGQRALADPRARADLDALARYQLRHEQRRSLVQDTEAVIPWLLDVWTGTIRDTDAVLRDDPDAYTDIYDDDAIATSLDNAYLRVAQATPRLVPVGRDSERLVPYLEAWCLQQANWEEALHHLLHAEVQGVALVRMVWDIVSQPGAPHSKRLDQPAYRINRFVPKDKRRFRPSDSDWQNMYEVDPGWIPLGTLGTHIGDLGYRRPVNRSDYLLHRWRNVESALGWGMGIAPYLYRLAKIRKPLFILLLQSLENHGGGIRLATLDADYWRSVGADGANAAMAQTRDALSELISGDTAVLPPGVTPQFFFPPDSAGRVLLDALDGYVDKRIQKLVNGIASGEGDVTRESYAAQRVLDQVPYDRDRSRAGKLAQTLTRDYLGMWLQLNPWVYREARVHPDQVIPPRMELEVENPIQAEARQRTLNQAAIPVSLDYYAERTGLQRATDQEIEDGEAFVPASVASGGSGGGVSGSPGSSMGGGGGRGHGSVMPGEGWELSDDGSPVAGPEGQQITAQGVQPLQVQQLQELAGAAAQIGLRDLTEQYLRRIYAELDEVYPGLDEETWQAMSGGGQEPPGGPAPPPGGAAPPGGGDDPMAALLGRSRLSELWSRRFDDSEQPRGQPGNAGQFAGKVELDGWSGVEAAEARYQGIVPPDLAADMAAEERYSPTTPAELADKWEEWSPKYLVWRAATDPEGYEEALSLVAPQEWTDERDSLLDTFASAVKSGGKTAALLAQTATRDTASVVTTINLVAALGATALVGAWGGWIPALIVAAFSSPWTWEGLDMLNLTGPPRGVRSRWGDSRSARYQALEQVLERLETLGDDPAQLLAWVERVGETAEATPDGSVLSWVTDAAGADRTRSRYVREREEPTQAERRLWTEYLWELTETGLVPEDLPEDLLFEGWQDYQVERQDTPSRARRPHDPSKHPRGADGKFVAKGASDETGQGEEKDKDTEADLEREHAREASYSVRDSLREEAQALREKVDRPTRQLRAIWEAENADALDRIDPDSLRDWIIDGSDYRPTQRKVLSKAMDEMRPGDSEFRRVLWNAAVKQSRAGGESLISVLREALDQVDEPDLFDPTLALDEYRTSMELDFEADHYEYLAEAPDHVVDEYLADLREDEADDRPAPSSRGNGEWGSREPGGQPFFRPGPNPTVDTVVTRDGPDGTEVLLIQRRTGGAEGGKWALPGGFVDSTSKKGEPFREDVEIPDEAALRELAEETGLDATTLRKAMTHVGTFGDWSEPTGRDPRDNEEAWSVSDAYHLHLDGTLADDVEGLDDAEAAEWVPVAQLGDLSLAFDHSDILAKAGVAKAAKKKTATKKKAAKKKTATKKKAAKKKTATKKATKKATTVQDLTEEQAEKLRATLERLEQDHPLDIPDRSKGERKTLIERWEAEEA